jgi:3-hydroxy-9,10-secoandrosta-1,3,5(10)-triene-9,17-dione monooxygenase reductase component
VSIDVRAFRHTAGQFVTGVTVIAAEVDGSIKAMTANSFTSVSLDPPLVLFCVGKTTHMGQLVHRATRFSVNILRQDQQNLSTYFAGGWKEPSPPPFTFVNWDGGHRLEGCPAAIGCAIETISEGGDHWLVLGRVLTLYRSEEAFAPLVFHAGRYATLEEREP